MSSQVYHRPQKPSGRYRPSDWYSVSVDSVRFWMGLVLVLALAVALFFGYGSWRRYWVEQRAYEWVSRAEGLVVQLETRERLSAPGFRTGLARAEGLLDDARAALSEQSFQVAAASGQASHELLQNLLDQVRLDSSIAWVRSVRGDVRLRRGETGDFVRSFARTELQEGDYLMAGDGGTAEIHFQGEDTVFTLQPNSLIKLSRGRAGSVRTLGEMEYGWVALDTAEQSSGVNTPFTSIVAREFTQASLAIERGSERAVVRVEEGSATATAVRTGDSRQLAERQEVTQSGDRFGETMPLSAAPELLEPADGISINIDVTDRIRLRWRPLPGAVKYALQVTRGRLFAENVVDTLREETSATMALEEGQFRWRVAVVDSRGRQGVWSDPRRLRVESYQSLAIEPDQEPPSIEVEVRMNGNFAVIQGRTEPGAKLTLNGRDIQTFADGTFSTTFVVTGTGARPLVFESVDLAGNSTIERRDVWVDEF